jgi:hypothetical protein
MADRTINELLNDKFTAGRNIDALVTHFQRTVSDYHQGKWENALAKGAKFLEAVLKALIVEAGLAPQTGRQFKVDAAINALGALSIGSVDDSIRLVIPRCCRFIYDVTSNRGGRHDPDGVDANEMDATAILGNCAWIVAEMVRYSQKQGDTAYAKLIVEALMKRRYPFLEEIEGRTYFDLKTVTSARNFGLLILWAKGTKRIGRDELIKAIMRQRRDITLKNARLAVTRLEDLVDDDGNGYLRLRASGFREAEQLIVSEPNEGV